MAERVGFEPTVRENRTLDFESSSFDHSDTSPDFLNAKFVHLISLGPSVALALRAPLRGVQIGCPADLSNPSRFA